MSQFTSDAKKMIIIPVTITVVSTVFVVIRLVLRRRQKMLGYDDLILILSLVLKYFQDIAAVIMATKGGIGKSMMIVTPDELTWLLKMFFWGAVMYTVLVTSIKISILTSLYRLFARNSWTKRSIIALGALCIGWGIAILFSVIFQCSPIHKAWEPLKPGHCIEYVPFLWGNSISNNILDWMILLLPIYPVWKLQMTTVQKLFVISSFALGSLACISSAIRTASTATFDQKNPTGTVFYASIWTFIEPACAIISACLPFLANLVGARAVGALEFIKSKSSSLFRSRQSDASAQTTARQPSDTSSDLGSKQIHVTHTYELTTEPRTNLIV